jgi:DNA polymerase-3 subunit beta
MKAVCEREKMLHAFQTVASVAPSRSPKPILQNVKLDVTADSAMLMGTDLEIGIRMEVQGFAIEQPGSIVLPIARFSSILRESSDEKLSLETTGEKTRVRGERSEFQLPSENPDEFPSVANFQEDKYQEMPARFFRELIRRTVFATDNESSRYALGGVLLEFTENGVIAVATDGRRLAKQEGPATSVGGHHLSEKMTIIPSRAMTLIERAISGSEENIQVSARDNDLLLKVGKTTIYTRLVEGRFPKWRDVFPRRDGTTQVDVTVGPFHAAVRQAAIVTSEEHRGVDFIFGEGKLTLSGHGAEMGESHIELPIAYDSAEVAVMLDPRYLSDFLRVLDPESTISLMIRDSESAVVCTTTDGYSNVIMPLARDRR